MDQGRVDSALCRRFSPANATAASRGAARIRSMRRSTFRASSSRTSAASSQRSVLVGSESSLSPLALGGGGVTAEACDCRPGGIGLDEDTSFCW